MNKNRRRGFGLLALASAALAACSVDTGGITFLADDDPAFDANTGAGDPNTGDTNTGDTGSGGAPDTGGSVTGGASSKAGSTSKAGNTSQAGSGTGGSAGGNVSGGTGGKANGGAAGVPPGGGPPGGNGFGGQMGCPPVVANRNEPMIDDFEDGNAGLLMKGGRAGGWYVTNDGTGTQVPPFDPTMPPKPETLGANMSKYAFHTKGMGFTDWGADIGTSFLTLPNMMVPCPYDVSPHMGIRFYLKGSISDGVLRISLPTVETDSIIQGGTCDPKAGVKCDDHYSYMYSPIPTDWKLVEVPFTSLKQQMFGPSVIFNRAHVMGIELGVRAMTSFDFWIDDVQFY